MSTSLGQSDFIQVAPARVTQRRVNARRPKAPATGWTVGTVALVVYLFVVHSYKINVGQYAIALGLFGVLAYVRPLRVSPPLYWYAGYLAWALVLIPASVDPGLSFTAWTDALKFLLIMFLAINAIRTPQQHRLITLAWLGMFAFFPVRGTLFNFLSGNGTGGRYAWNALFGNPNDLAALTLIPLAMLLDRLWSSDKKWVKVCAISGLIVLPFIILITQSRGGEMGLATMFLLLLARSRYKKKIAMAMVVIAALAIAFAPKSVWDRIGNMTYLTSVETLGQSDSSAEQRYLIWQVAEKIIADNPVQGIGIGLYSTVHESYARSRPEWAFAGGQRDTHNAYLHTAAETGVVGLFLLLMVFATSAFELAKTSRALKNSTDVGDRQLRDRCQVYLAALAGLTVCATFGSLETMVFPFLFVALAAAAVRVRPTPAATPSRR